jgi:hypothetical protein
MHPYESEVPSVGSTKITEIWLDTCRDRLVDERRIQRAEGPGLPCSAGNKRAPKFPWKLAPPRFCFLEPAANYPPVS